MVDPWISYPGDNQSQILYEVFDSFHKEQDGNEYTFITDHMTTLVEGLNKLRLEFPELCDVHIKTKQKMVYGHSSILAVFSGYFKTLFTTKLHSNSRSPEGIFIVDLSQFSQLSLELLLHFVYNNQNLCEDDFDELDILEFLLLLDYTGMDCILKMFTRAIKLNIKIDTWFKWYEVAEQHGLDKLKAVTLSYPACHFDKYIRSEEFQSLPYSILELLLNCELVTCYPLDVLKEAVTKWLDANDRDKKVYIGMLKESFPEIVDDIIDDSQIPQNISNSSDIQRIGKSTKWSVQECVFISKFEYQYDEEGAGDHSQGYNFLFELNSQSKDSHPKLSEVWIDNSFFREQYEGFALFGKGIHFFWRQQMHLVYKDFVQKRLRIAIYDLCEEWDRKCIFIPIKVISFHFEVKSAMCFGDMLHVILSFPGNLLYVYLINLVTTDYKHIHAIDDVVKIVPTSRYSITCYSFTEQQLIQYGDLKDKPISTICNIWCENKTFQTFEKHLVSLKGKMYCFVENNMEQKLCILLLQEGNGRVSTRPIKSINPINPIFCPIFGPICPINPIF